MYPHHINDPEFANALVDSFLEISMKSPLQSTPLQVASPKPSQVHESSVAKMNFSSCETTPHSLSDFPDAKPGCFGSFK